VGSDGACWDKNKLQRLWLILILCFALQPLLVQEVFARAEYVFVQKSMDDKAIIVRHNGASYLIEKGVGCLSLWRYEGKKVLINSPGIFLGIGSEILIPDLGQKCRIWNSEAIGSSRTPSFPPSVVPQVPSIGGDCSSGHWIQSKSSDGSIITLEDGSVWQVGTIDRIYSAIWLPITNVIVCSGEMINLSNSEKVGVTRLK